jgi:hypothetical protein
MHRLAAFLRWGAIAYAVFWAAMTAAIQFTCPIGSCTGDNTAMWLAVVIFGFGLPVAWLLHRLGKRLGAPYGPENNTIPAKR